MIIYFPDQRASLLLMIAQNAERCIDAAESVQYWMDSHMKPKKFNERMNGLDRAFLAGDWRIVKSGFMLRIYVHDGLKAILSAYDGEFCLEHFKGNDFYEDARTFATRFDPKAFTFPEQLGRIGGWDRKAG